MSKLQRRFIELISVFLGIVFSSSAQLNWVRNGGFEDIIQCPSDNGQINYCSNWDTLIVGGGSPDYFNKCAEELPFKIPQTGYGYQESKSGNGFSGLISFNKGPDGYVDREYSQGNLKEKLDFESFYCITYYLSFAFESSQFAIDRMGVFLDNGLIQAPESSVANVVPQIESPNGEFLKDSLNWMKIQGVFKATGVETHITLGNFRSRETTNSIEYGGCFECGTYYFIDDVSVIDITTQAFAGNDTLIGAGDSVFIGIPDVGDNFKWYANGTLIHEGSEAGIWVKPTETTKYVCEQHVCSYVTKDTVEVKVSGLGFSFTSSGIAYEAMLLPNPSSTGKLKIHAPSSEGIRVRVVSISGCIDTSRAYGMYLYNQNTGNHVFETTETVFEPGVYVVEITDVNTNQMVVLKWVVL